MASQKSDKLTPLDMAINQTEALLATLKRAKAGTSYPPVEQAHLWRAIDEHARVKGFIDREQTAIAVAWDRARSASCGTNPPAGVTPLETAPRSCQEVPAGGACDTGRQDADTESPRIPGNGADIPSVSRAELRQAGEAQTSIEAA